MFIKSYYFPQFHWGVRCFWYSIQVQSSDSSLYVVALYSSPLIPGKEKTTAVFSSIVEVGSTVEISLQLGT